MTSISLEKVLKPFLRLQELGLQQTTLKAIINKWRKYETIMCFPRSGWPMKIPLNFYLMHSCM
ncbi:hypothetical protein GJAV_G00202880 [Gymnothorax javanicus]|nr:hypothetical protein GJAV_G00202880 [Gymnothorax javanicus]